MNDSLEIYYIHNSTKVVFSLSELKKISNYKKIAIQEPYYDATLGLSLEHEYIYTKVDILTGKDWTIIPLMKDNLTEEEKIKLKENLDSIKFYEMLKSFERKGQERERSLGGV